MARFQRKPKVVEAARWIEDGEKPGWLIDAIEEGKIVLGGEPTGFPSARIGIFMRVIRGDWIIRDGDGELASCTDELFEKNYEAVDVAK